ncbi:MAG TPA: ABC transporter substrate-binding protein [Planctomycetota bacterium]|nr:ABC transporter substrate-binding protein [Planctomycetota bacterium]
MFSRSRLAALALLALAGCGKSDPPASAAADPTVVGARKLLADAGFADGKGFPKLEVLYNTDDYHKQIASAIQEMWRVNLGINVDLRNMEFPLMMGAVRRGEFEIARQGYIGEFSDPLAFLELFTEDSKANSTGWTSPTYEELVASSNDLADPTKRLEALEQAERLLIDEAPLFPIFFYVAHNLIKPFVKGVYPNARDIHPLQGVTLEGAGAPKDGVLIFNGGAEPQSIDPALSRDIGGYKILMHLMEGLVMPDEREGAPRAALAERWEVSEDGKTYLFHLRPSTWSNGDPVTAGDFVYAWRRVVTPATGSGYSHRMYVVENAREIVKEEKKPETLGVRAVDDRTLEVKLVRRTPYFLQLLCMNIYFPVHRATVEKYGAKFMEPQHAVVNGPYRMTEWTLKQRKVFEKNPSYRDAGSVKLAKFIFLGIENAETAFKYYETGQCHWLFRIPLPVIDVERPDHLVNPYNGCYFYVFNTRKKPLDDVRVRRALGMAIDRAKICKYILRGGETPAFRLVPPTSLPPR